jgi:hypothetical protein
VRNTRISSPKFPSMRRDGKRSGQLRYLTQEKHTHSKDPLAQGAIKLGSVVRLIIVGKCTTGSRRIIRTFTSNIVQRVDQNGKAKREEKYPAQPLVDTRGGFSPGGPNRWKQNNPVERMRTFQAPTL